MVKYKEKPLINRQYYFEQSNYFNVKNLSAIASTTSACGLEGDVEFKVFVKKI